MKQLLISIIIAFVASIASCLFNVFQSILIATLGGSIVLFLTTFLRLSFISRRGENIEPHSMLMFIAGFVPLFILSISTIAFGFIYVIGTWGVSIVMAYICHKIRNMKICAGILAIWIFAIIFMSLKWDGFIVTLIK